MLSVVAWCWGCIVAGVSRLARALGLSVVELTFALSGLLVTVMATVWARELLPEVAIWISYVVGLALGLGYLWALAAIARGRKL